MTVKQRVENILKASREARNSDDMLEIIYMQKSGMNLSEEQIACFKRMPKMETIRRERQKFQEVGLYPADEAVDKARFEKFREVRENIKYSSVEELLESQGKRVLPWHEG